MTEIAYLKGDATCPQARGPKVIAHVCNDLGRWGKGFVLALSARWPEPERAYRDWHRGRAENDFGLGAVQLVQVGCGLWVANMVGQHGLRGGRVPPIRYAAVGECLAKVAEKARQLGVGPRAADRLRAGRRQVGVDRAAGPGGPLRQGREGDGLRPVRWGMLEALKRLFVRLRTPPPPVRAAVRLTEDGFAVERGGQAPFRVRWQEVKEVFGFKLDLLTTDCACLGFRVSDAGDYRRVDEEMPGYADLVEAMQRHFPDYNKDWWSEVAFPAFATNYTTVWGEPLP
jgi:O-acetyl-ADP-ribose deacetylase (regulator of RNase III)